MRQLFLDKGNIIVKEVAQPLLNDESVLVAVQYAYVSNTTDISHLDTQAHLLNNVPHKVKRVLEAVAFQAGYQKDSYHGYKTGISYSCTGHVIAVGRNVSKFAPGDLVACMDFGLSPHIDLICVTQSKVVKVSHKKYLKHASITSYATTALHAVRRIPLQIGERVCVVGLDIIGLLTVQLAKIAGCFVIGLDVNQASVDLALTLGIDAGYCYEQDSTKNEITLLTEDHGVDVAIVTYCSDINFKSVMDIVRPGGDIVLLNSMSALRDEYVLDKDVDILIAHSLANNTSMEQESCASRWNTYRNMQECLKLIETGALLVEPLITEEVTIDALASLHKRMVNRLSFGGIVRYSQFISPEVTRPASCQSEASFPEISETNKRFMPAVSDTLKIGILGVNSCMQNSIVSTVAHMKNISITKVVDRSPERAAYLASQLKGATSGTQEQDVLENQDVDIVMIASSHTQHADYALKGLQQGKAVLVETPMAADSMQLQRLCSFLQKNAHVPFMVNYHYAFSPFIQKIKKVLVKRHTPLIGSYRMNKTITREHRHTMNRGVGAIISDVCHMVDLFCFLTDSYPTSVSVEAMHSTRDDIFPTENLSASIAFNDGSVCSLFYTTLGHTDMGEHYLEIFYDKKAIQMEDYMELYGFGLPSWFNETVIKADTGQGHLMQAYLESLSRPNYIPSISQERLHMAAEVTLIIDTLACEGGGKKELK